MLAELKEAPKEIRDRPLPAQQLIVVRYNHAA